MFHFGMILLLGPPSSGKTTLLLALAGRIATDLQVSGKITYNGHGLKEFVPQRTSAYVSQHDWHVAEMTVRETLDFSANCQGVGFKYDMLMELARREKISGIKPDEDHDLFMKALALGGQETALVVEYILKEVSGDALGEEFKGYVFKIMGCCDKQGFPMKQGVLTPDRVRLLLVRRYPLFPRPWKAQWRAP